jgi:hypothetical protein
LHGTREVTNLVFVMKRYILLTDDKVDILSVIGRLVNLNMNFEYRGSSRSLIFEVNNLDEAEAINKSLEIFEIRINEFKA